MLVCVLGVPFLRDLFHFSPLDAVDVGLAVAAGVLSIVWFEALKVLKVRMT
jgi:hypothetical protein